MQLKFEWVICEETKQAALIFNEETWSVLEAAASLRGLHPTQLIAQAVVERLRPILEMTADA